VRGVVSPGSAQVCFCDCGDMADRIVAGMGLAGELGRLVQPQVKLVRVAACERGCVRGTCRGSGTEGGDGRAAREGSCHRTLGRARSKDQTQRPTADSFAMAKGELGSLTDPLHGCIAAAARAEPMPGGPRISAKAES
jgi:hypothetical protein